LTQMVTGSSENDMLFRCYRWWDIKISLLN